MESHAKLFGHAIHPILIVFPLGLLATSVIFDIISVVTGTTDFAIASFYGIAAGVIGGLLAAVFGFWDWLHIPEGTRAKAVGLWHGVGNVVVVVLFIVAWLLRGGQPSYLPMTLPLILELLGVGLALMTGWLGGELVERLGVGVDPEANLNAPSSLSGRGPEAGRRGGRRLV